MTVSVIAVDTILLSAVSPFVNWRHNNAVHYLHKSVRDTRVVSVLLVDDALFSGH